MSKSKRTKRGASNLSRRTFLKLSALAGSAALASRITYHPALGSVMSPLTVPPDKEITITEKWVPTSCLNCSTRCATRVRVVNGKAVQIIGNPFSGVSEGANCPRGNVGLQVLYDAGRFTSPLKRTNPAKGKDIDPRWVSISWSQALNEVSESLKSLRGKGQPHQLLILHGLNTISDEDFIRRFADAYGTPNVISDNALDNDSDKAGEWLADGNYTQGAYDLAHTSYILAFGVGILESHKPLAPTLRLWGKIRRERPNRAKVVVIDPRYSVTAARADRWLPINPGTDAALAMAIANVIISEKLYDTSFIENWTTGFQEYQQLVLSSYHPDTIAPLTGIHADTIRAIAREFAGTRPAIAWRGRGATSWPGGSYAGYAIFCLNALVGSIDVPGGVIYQEDPDYRDIPGVSEDEIAGQGKTRQKLDLSGTGEFPAAQVVTNQIADSILEAKPYPVEVAIGFNSNFNMSAPGTSRWDEAMKKFPYYVHVAPSPSEMADYADIVLPSPTFLEEWAYDHSPPGSGFAEFRLKQPVVEPSSNTKSIIDIIFELAQKQGGTVAQSFAGIGRNAEEFVKYRTETIMPWAELLDKGVWVGPAYQYQKYDRIFKTPSKRFEFYSGNLEMRFKELGKSIAVRLAFLPHYEPVRFLGDEKVFPLLLSRYQPVLDVENGSQNYPWAQELFLVMHGMGWTNFAEMNTLTAQGLGIRDGDAVWVESPFGKIKLKARVFEGIHPGVVSIAIGQGHYAYGKWAKGIGVNPNDIIGVDYDRLSGQAAFFNTRVRVYKA